MSGRWRGQVANTLVGQQATCGYSTVWGLALGSFEFYIYIYVVLYFIFTSTNGPPPPRKLS